MKRNVMFLALFITAFLFPTVGSVSNADAQAGSRLCGISLGPMAILLEIKQPDGKKGRRAANRFCDKVAGDMEQGLKDGGIDTANVIFYKRTEFEDVARDISRGKGSYDICDLMKRSSVGNGAHPYTITHVEGDNFEDTQQ
jgi:hypothetical protein